MKYFQINNKTKSCIVINSCKLVLKPCGTIGESIIVDEDRIKDNEVVGLINSGLVSISSPKIKKNKIKIGTFEEDQKDLEEKTSKTANKMGSQVTYVDAKGKIKKGKMKRSVHEIKTVNEEVEEAPDLIDPNPD